MESRSPLGSYLAPRLEHATAGDAMRPQVLTCTPETPLVTAAQRMAGEHVHALVVLAPRGEDAVERYPWAVLTDRDLLRNAERAEELTAGDVASTDLLQVTPTDRLTEVARRMIEHAAGHAVVVDERTRRPVGVVSTLDIAGIVGWGRG
jgi:CBS domain-containing protein